MTHGNFSPREIILDDPISVQEAKEISDRLTTCNLIDLPGTELSKLFTEIDTIYEENHLLAALDSPVAFCIKPTRNETAK